GDRGRLHSYISIELLETPSPAAVAPLHQPTIPSRLTQLFAKVPSGGRKGLFFSTHALGVSSALQWSGRKCATAPAALCGAYTSVEQMSKAGTLRYRFGKRDHWLR